MHSSTCQKFSEYKKSFMISNYKSSGRSELSIRYTEQLSDGGQVEYSGRVWSQYSILITIYIVAAFKWLFVFTTTQPRTTHQIDSRVLLNKNTQNVTPSFSITIRIRKTKTIPHGFYNRAYFSIISKHCCFGSAIIWLHIIHTAQVHLDDGHRALKWPL